PCVKIVSEMQVMVKVTSWFSCLYNLPLPSTSVKACITHTFRQHREFHLPSSEMLAVNCLRTTIIQYKVSAENQASAPRDLALEKMAAQQVTSCGHCHAWHTGHLGHQTTEGDPGSSSGS
ncbi:mCG145448, partial [Mus musculus]